MGQFSWITQDTGESIRNNGGESKSSRRKRRAYMHDDKGNIWEELDYEGYGRFGGKDYYELLAEMNGKKTRKEGIDIEFGPSEGKLFPNLTRNKNWEWVNTKPSNCPNQGWSDIK